jgi:hypothetical protein
MSNVLIETNTQIGNFSQAVDGASFAIPAGFKQAAIKSDN